MSAISTVTYILPAHWAGFLINNDWDSISESDYNAIQRFQDRHPNLNLNALDCGPDYFAWTNNAIDCGAMVAEFTFAEHS